jgi:hypothetical protein
LNVRLRRQRTITVTMTATATIGRATARPVTEYAASADTGDRAAVYVRDREESYTARNSAEVIQ